jgi:hypothetical protein
MHEIAFNNQECSETQAITIWWVLLGFQRAHSARDQTGLNQFKQSAQRLFKIIGKSGC